MLSDWSSESLSFVSPIHGPPPSVTLPQVRDAIKKMKSSIKAGSPGIVAKMLKASGSVGLEVLVHLLKSVIAEGVVPADWRDINILSLYKGKEDALDQGN